jgi:hypothetical protein
MGVEVLKVKKQKFAVIYSIVYILNKRQECICILLFYQRVEELLSH